MMDLKITFINPNNDESVEEYLPKILAEALINKIVKEAQSSSQYESSNQIKYSA